MLLICSITKDELQTKKNEALTKDNTLINNLLQEIISNLLNSDCKIF